MPQHHLKRGLTLALAAVACANVYAQRPGRMANFDPDTIPAGKYTTYLVSTAHFDSQWNWDIRESIDDYLHRTMVQNFWLFERFPNYVFNFESAQKYAWMKEYYPEEFERVRDYVKQRRWNISGSAWEATDPNMPAAESFFRNILYGQEFYKREFGVKGNDIYLPDCFGFGWTLPTIASHCGLIGFSTQKLQWRKSPFYANGQKMPFPIGLWQGIDGSRIMAVCDAGGYGTAYHYGDDITRNHRIIDRSMKDPNRISYTYYGVGDRGGSPTLSSVVEMERALATTGPVKVIAARSGQLYEDFLPFDKHPELPVHDGELLMDVHGVGCYTSQAAMKRFNRRNENLAVAAEGASTAATILGAMDYPAEQLRKNWQRFLWHQFHDDLTGTSIPRSYTFSWNDELIAQTLFADAITAAVGGVSRALDTRTSGTPVVVYNPVSTDRTDIVEATVPMSSKPRGINVTGPDGKSVPAQLIGWADGKARIIFSAKVPSMGYAVYGVNAGNPGRAKNLKASGRTIENEIYTLTLDENGDIKSLIDRRNGRELVQEGKPFRLMVLTEDISRDYPAWEVYKTTLDGPSTGITGNVRISVEESGPLRAALKVERDYRGSQFTQHIILTEGAADDVVRIVNDVDWHGKKAMVKAEFPTTTSAAKASYDLGLGHVERGNNSDCAFEVLGHKWADVSADGYGISILNDCKYGWDKPDNNTLRLTLFHTPETGKFYDYQDHQDHGRHTFSYAIIGHEGNAVSAGTPAKADAFNQPMAAFAVPRHAGRLGKTYSLASSSTPDVAIKAIKQAEDGDGYIVRIHETAGKDYADATLTFGAEIASASEVNGIEEPLREAKYSGKGLHLGKGKAFGPRTFRVKFASAPASLDKASTINVALPLNAVALTSDAMNRTGNFDRRGNSLAAELMPDTIDVNGVKVAIANDPAYYNYLRCNGDTIQLPEHKGMTQLYVLATSTDKDRRATWSVDGVEHETVVPYYSGFYGQWGWDGESEGYIRSTPLAYVADHKHSAAKGNASYDFAYIYKIRLDIPENARTLVMPRDAGVAVFGVALSGDENLQAQPLTEMRALPEATVTQHVTDVPVAFYMERGAW